MLLIKLIPAVGLILVTWIGYAITDGVPLWIAAGITCLALVTIAAMLVDRAEEDAQ
jgi:hypothetical protein